MRFKNNQKKALRRKSSKLKSIERKFSKLNIQPGDIILFHTDNEQRQITDEMLRSVLDAGANLVIVLRAKETLESIAPRLFQESIAEYIGGQSRSSGEELC